MVRLILACTLLFAHVLNAADINVYAASSLTDVLKELGATFSAHSPDHVVFNFAASNLLARQIEEGAPADLFFSADETQMDRLEKENEVVKETRRDLLSNTLVVVAPEDSRVTVSSPADLRKVTRIAVGDPKFVPVGVYTNAYLEKVGLWGDLESKILPTENVRAGLATVESGNADVAFVYSTDAGISKKVKVLFRVPADQCPPIRYPLALMSHAQNAAVAKEFLDYLTSDAAKPAFEKAGFIVLR